jgi:hypothetical protein
MQSEAFSHPQHKTRSLLRRWAAHADLTAEQVAEQGAAAVTAGLHLGRESVRAGWGLARLAGRHGLDTWRRALALLR